MSLFDIISDWINKYLAIHFKYSSVYKMDNQQGPDAKHRELCSILCNNLNGKRIWKRIDICICTTESFCCICEEQQQKK